MQLLYKLKKLPNYVSVFGILDGLRLFLMIEFCTREDSSVRRRIRVPGLASPVYLRRTIADHSAFWLCIVAGQYSVDAFPQCGRLHAAYDAMVADGKRPLIIDAGANIGMSALWYANRYPQARVYAIEPDAENFELLLKNITGLEDRIIPFYGGVWHRDSNLIIENPESGSQRFRTREVASGVPGSCRSITINSILDRMQADAVFIAKIDIEGGQAALFQENTHWVSNAHLIVLELDDWQFPWAGTSRSVFSCLPKYPFDYLLHGENVFFFRDFYASEEVRT